MSSAKRYLLIALSFAVALTVFAAFGPRAVHAVTATLVQVANTSANPVPVSTATHFGVPSANLVTLRTAGPNMEGRITPDGTYLDGWQVPAGQLLIVTDYSISGGYTPSQPCGVSVYIGSNTVDQMVPAADAGGFVSGARQITFAVAPGFHPWVAGCAGVNWVGYFHGYLVSQ